MQNVTDVDDPLLERVDRDGENWRELACWETQRYREDMEALRVLPLTHLIGVRGAARHRAVQHGWPIVAPCHVDEDVYHKSADPGWLSGPGTASGTVRPRWPN